MATITMAAQSRTNVRNVFVAVVLTIVLFGILASIKPASTSIVQPVGTELGAFERAYFLDGNRAPVFVDTGVNASITMLAAVNADVAATVRPGEDVNGNSERLMFGID